MGRKVPYFVPLVKNETCLQIPLFVSILLKMACPLFGVTTVRDFCLLYQKPLFDVFPDLEKKTWKDSNETTAWIRQLEASYVKKDSAKVFAEFDTDGNKYLSFKETMEFAEVSEADKGFGYDKSHFGLNLPADKGLYIYEWRVLPSLRVGLSNQWPFISYEPPVSQL